MSNERISGAANTPSPDSPYVGLRPYERHERDLFVGRNRDATMLCNKIFSARLTLYYGPSGVGKSSILRTLVIPLLENQDAQGLYYDEWRGPDPLEVLKARLVEEATSAGIPSAGAGAPTLVELAALISTHTRKTLVLILDQFEEFLTVHSQQLDPLRRELGAVVRATTVDVRLVLSLRQEFLASLEPFRNEILTLFESTHRLEPLDDADARAAIEEPARRFGKTYEPKLIEVLVDDFRDDVDKSPGANSPNARAVDLPTMQLVCSELWGAARKLGDGKIITRRLYEVELGGKQRILTNYINKNVPNDWRNRYLTAALMRFLAPVSGLKAAYSAEDLAEHTGASMDRIRTELRRLEDARILRTRGVRSEQLFELQHDAFIAIIAPWRDRVLRRARNFRRARKTAGIVIAGVAIAGLVVGGERFAAKKVELSNHYRALSDLREWEGRALEERADATFDAVTRFLLTDDLLRRAVVWPQGNLDKLKDLLTQNENLLPKRYDQLSHTDLSSSCVACFLPDSARDRTPLAVDYSSGNLDEAEFKAAWKLEADKLNQEWGIPVPHTVNLRADEKLIAAAVRLSGPDFQLQEVRIPSFVKDVFIINPDGLHPLQAQFLNKFSSDRSAWTPFTTNEKNWWIVPRWSLPVWHWSNHETMNRSGFAARLLGDRLRHAPELLVVPGAVEHLMRQEALARPQTVAEARAARGDRLRQDLVEIVRRRRSLAGDLPLLLDALAHYPDEDSPTVAKLVVEDVAAPDQRPTRQATGPWPSSPQLKAAVTSPSSIAYIEALKGMPSTERPWIAAELGDDLITRWRSGPTGLAVSLSKRIDEYRSSFARRYGVLIPGIRFRTADKGKALPGMAFRLTVLGHGAPPVVARGDDPIATLIDTLDPRVHTWRARWLSVEHVESALESTRPDLRQWLKANYSLTDIKLLLRDVLGRPTLGRTADGAGAAGDAAGAPEQTLRYGNWLLRSLVFWSHVSDRKDISAMAQRLRDTQRSRVQLNPSEPGSSAAASVVDSAIKALVNGNIETAERAFSRALASDRDGAIEAFLTLYPASMPRLIVREFADACQNLADVRRMDVEEVVRRADFSKAVDLDAGRRMTICILANAEELNSKDGVALATLALDRLGTVDSKSAADASTAARKILADDELVGARAPVVQRASDVLRNAVTFLPAQRRIEIVEELLDRCEQPGPRNVCWTLASDLCGSFDESYSSGWGDELSVRLRLLSGLSYRERKDDLERGLRAADTTARLIERMFDDKGKKQEFRDYLELLRSELLTRLALLGEESRTREAEELLTRLLASPAAKGEAAVLLAGVRQRQGQYAEAHQLIALAERATGKTAMVYASKLMLQLGTGDAAGVAATSDEIVRVWEQRPAGEHLDMQFLGALGIMLTRVADGDRLFIRQFLETKHEYVPYVALMLYASMAEKHEARAPDLIRERWSQAQAQTWPARLSAGDERAWREMLLGYFTGAVSREALFGPLEDGAKYAASPLAQLPVRREGLLTEAYFYDALLASSRGNAEARRRSLEEVVQLNRQEYWEYQMATFLLRRQP